MKIKPHKNYYICNQPNINSHSLMMKQLIACCGLDCESCDARIATVRDDNYNIVVDKFALPTKH